MARARRRRQTYYGSAPDWGGWAPYVSVASRRKHAAQEVAERKKRGETVSPVLVEGRLIVKTFWGKAWCENLERYSDYANRLPRGRSYVRNGSVVDLQITAGKVTALVQGSSMYTVTITVKAVERGRWEAMVAECSGQIDSVVELLSGKLSSAVMVVMTRKGEGLFPAPAQIQMRCSCPDSATMCKHVAATFYGVGARLDERPELLFELRGVTAAELVTKAAAGGLLRKGTRSADDAGLRGANLSSLFGIDLDTDEEEVEEVAAKPPGKSRAKASTKAPAKVPATAPAKVPATAAAKAPATAAAKVPATAAAKTVAHVVAKARAKAAAKRAAKALAKAPAKVAVQVPVTVTVQARRGR